MAVGVAARQIAEERVNQSVGGEAAEAIGQVTSIAALMKSRAGKAGVVDNIQSVIWARSAKVFIAVAAFTGRVACVWSVDIRFIVSLRGHAREIAVLKVPVGIITRRTPIFIIASEAVQSTGSALSTTIDELEAGTLVITVVVRSVMVWVVKLITNKIYKIGIGISIVKID